MAYNETPILQGETMTIKNFAKEAAFRIGLAVFPVRPRQQETVDVEEQIARVQASFRNAVKDDLKPKV
jgi:hypothetical protein